jgi:outer membrane lipoprotein-sorting protein
MRSAVVSPLARVFVRVVRVSGLVTAVGLTVAGCSCEPPPPPAATAIDDVIVTKALDVLGKRLTPVRDVAVEGEVVDRGSGQRLRFRYAMQQPGALSAELVDPASATRLRAFVFDGNTLSIVDDTTKTVARQDLKANPEQMLLTLHEIFSQFVCEGWRPPLVKPQGVLGAAAGDTWTLTIPIVDEVLNSQRLVLRTDGSFVKKELVDDRGAIVAATTVLEDWKDPSTGIVFPRRWSHTERGSTQEVTLTAMVVNGGVDASRFSTSTPPGYGERSP